MFKFYYQFLSNGVGDVSTATATLIFAGRKPHEKNIFRPLTCVNDMETVATKFEPSRDLARSEVCYVD